MVDSNQWPNIEVNVALCGISGSGKSQFINTILGLRADDPGAAPVDAFGSQRTTWRYKHPELPGLIFWDLPGIGTGEYGRDNYLKTVDFNTYDFYLIFGRGRFYEEDAWLVKHVNRRRKRFFYIRTHIDQDIASKKRDGDKTSAEESCLDIVRNDCETQIQHAGIKVTHTQVYLISTRLQDKDKWDFPKLNSDMLQHLPRIIRETDAVAISVPYLSDINVKIQSLRDNVRRIVFLSGILAAVPVPFLPLVADVFLILRQIKTYENTLTPTELSLRRLGLTNSWKFQVTGFGRLLGEFLKFSLYFTVSPYPGYVTVLGCALSAFLAYRMTGFVLFRSLKIIEEEKIKMLK
ncbi:T-cell-specific guanine nucleotide triphosphate-binding protein 1-like [Lingula anatina]|uniref:T-cell-specific guanine nucleotide triphosphate-binding protein 1-like n=1 Tax=Lingula anatina TaxID=7574 RepID=A0A1S3H725_LINAN|nr:T-cell-specific guanine nucleotide triphosphate-binding protein 1-like [Lingula anatina]|eukprot:XP_013381782.1 T-cell-specific guanine nucleotide triphosphate-binding protein 1-like [Lingula anatina]